MFTDMKGKKRLKIGLHTHTTRSDGKKTPEEALALYAAAGYDAVALTDHWKFGEAGKVERRAAGEEGGEDMVVLTGCEYDMGGVNPESGVRETFHVVGVGMRHDPEISRDTIRDESILIYDRVKMVVRQIRQAGGVAVLAHPAWSLNTPEQILAAGDFDALEIFNSVSECGMSDRPYSGLLVDMLGARGVSMPLLATDDTHYYNGDECKGMIMVEADAVEASGLGGAIRDRKFYATQGPEIHLERISEDQVKLTCSPAEKIVFFSELPWVPDRVVRGKNLTEALYRLKLDRQERFVRAEVTDENGLMAWSNIIMI